MTCDGCVFAVDDFSVFEKEGDTWITVTAHCIKCHERHKNTCTVAELFAEDCGEFGLGGDWWKQEQDINDGNESPA